MYAYEWDNGEPLSCRGDESCAVAVERTPHTLLRPVFINAVEVGYAYSQCDKDRRLNVRGVTLALWYFISRGHQVLALLPYCFKSYADKSSSWTELMSLFKMNLVEFTPGFGSDKYVEVNRILASRADEVGGCIVARSQMHNVVEERPTLNRTVEKRLLMPSFNGSDIIFPVDGPLGRGGPTLQATLECTLDDPEWGRCSHHQMTLKDQILWMQKLTLIVPEQISWSALTSSVLSFSPSIPLPSVSLPPRPPVLSHPKIHPPETNPIDGKGYSYTRAAIRRANPEMYENQMSYRDGLGMPTMCNEYENIERGDPFTPEYMKTGVENGTSEPRFVEAAAPLPNFLGNPDSIYRIRPTSHGDSEPTTSRSASRQAVSPTTSQKQNTQAEQSANRSQTAEEKERLTKLARIFGWEKANRVIRKYHRVRNINLLVEFALNESDSDMSSSQEHSNSTHSMGETENAPPPTVTAPSAPPASDLINFEASSVEAGSKPAAADPPPAAQSTSLLD